MPLRERRFFPSAARGGQIPAGQSRAAFRKAAGSLLATKNAAA